MVISTLVFLRNYILLNEDHQSPSGDNAVCR
jgi:hypothetical protein